MKLETVDYETDKHVAIITLNRPKSMNAFNIQMRRDFAAAQTAAHEDNSIRVIVLAAYGKAFSSGTDLKEGDATTAKSGVFDNSIRDYKPLLDKITRSDKIYIAAINGFVGGVALGMVLGSDLAMMSERAVLSSPFANVGLVPDGGTSFYLYQTMGYKRAFEAIVECTLMDAQTCQDMGLINRVVAPDDLRKAAIGWAHTLADRAPLSLQYTKQILRNISGMDAEAVARLESEYQMKCGISEDAKIAITAFIQKTKPQFKGM